MKKMLLIAAVCFLMPLCSIADSIETKTDEVSQYEDLQDAENPEELIETAVFTTKEGNEAQINLLRTKVHTYGLLMNEPSQTGFVQTANLNIPGVYGSVVIQELIPSENPVIIPYNGRSAYLYIFAKLADGTYVDVTDLVEWQSENNDIVYAGGNRITARNQGTTIVKASLAGLEVSINVQVENYIDLQAEIDRLNSLYPNSPGNLSAIAAAQNERVQILLRAQQMINVAWTPTQNLVGWRMQYVFPAGVTVTGIPYTQNEQKEAGGFLNALSAGDFYAPISISNKIMPRYGSDCSGFLSFAWGISRKTTLDFVNGIKNGVYSQVGSYSENLETPNSSDLMASYNYLKPGDGLVRRTGGSGHALLVAAVDPENKLVHVYEQTPPKANINTWTYEDLAEEGFKPFTDLETNGWYKLGENWFYHDDAGWASGWKQIDGYTYYFSSQDFRMVTDWQLIDGVWYYFNLDNGSIYEGWLQYNDYWYYLKLGSGAMAANEALVIDGTTYYFDSSGACTNPFPEVSQAEPTASQTEPEVSQTGPDVSQTGPDTPQVSEVPQTELSQTESAESQTEADMPKTVSDDGDQSQEPLPEVTETEPVDEDQSQEHLPEETEAEPVDENQSQNLLPETSEISQDYGG